MQGMQHEQHIVGADSRMLREEGEESQYASRRSGTGEQQEVEHPERLPLPYAEVRGGGYDGKQQRRGLQGGDSARLLPEILQLDLHQRHLLGDQRALLPLAVCDASVLEVTLQAERHEHLLPPADRPVRLGAHAEIHAEACPGMPLGVLVQQMPERQSLDGRLHVVSVLQRAVQSLGDDVPRAGGTVVVEKVIAVHAVFGAAVLLQKLHQTQFLLPGEVERLLADVAFQVGIFGGKAFVAADPQLVVGLAQGEAQDEVRGIETEHAVVEDGVYPACRVFVAYGRMPEEGIYFFPRAAGQQADADGICLLRPCSEGGKEDQ